MKTIDEQYKIQYNETKRYWRRKRHKRAIVFSILTTIGIILLIISANTELFSITKYILGYAIIMGIGCIIRELIVPMTKEKIELNRLERIYDEERFKERNG